MNPNLRDILGLTPVTGGKDAYQALIDHLPKSDAIRRILIVRRLDRISRGLSVSSQPGDVAIGMIVSALADVVVASSRGGLTETPLFSQHTRQRWAWLHKAAGDLLRVAVGDEPPPGVGLRRSTRFFLLEEANGYRVELPGDVSQYAPTPGEALNRLLSNVIIDAITTHADAIITGVQDAAYFIAAVEGRWGIEVAVTAALTYLGSDGVRKYISPELRSMILDEVATIMTRVTPPA